MRILGLRNITNYVTCHFNLSVKLPVALLVGADQIGVAVHIEKTISMIVFAIFCTFCYCCRCAMIIDENGGSGREPTANRFITQIGKERSESTLRKSVGFFDAN